MIDREARPMQCIADRVGERGVIFNQKYTHVVSEDITPPAVMGRSAMHVNLGANQPQ